MMCPYWDFRHITIVAVNSFIRGQVGGSAFMAEEWPSASAEEAADVSQTISHMLATLVNLCIGAPDRKDKCLQSPQFVTLLADLLRLDEHRDVRLSCLRLCIYCEGPFS